MEESFHSHFRVLELLKKVTEKLRVVSVRTESRICNLNAEELNILSLEDVFVVRNIITTSPDNVSIYLCGGLHLLGCAMLRRPQASGP